MGFLSGLTSTIAAILGAIAGALVGIVLTVFAYEGLVVPVPFTSGIQVFPGKLVVAVNKATTLAKTQCETTNLQARIQTLETLLAAAARVTEQDKKNDAAAAAELDRLKGQNDDYATQLDKKEMELDAADKRAEEAAAQAGVKVEYRYRCPRLTGTDIDELRNVWKRGGKGNSGGTGAVK